MKPVSCYSDGKEACEPVATTHTKVLNSEVKFELGEIKSSSDDAVMLGGLEHSRGHQC